MTSKELEGLIKKLAGRGSAKRSTVEVAPGCAFGAVADQRLKTLEQSLGELKARLNGLLFLVAGAVLVEILMRLLG